MTSLTWGLVWQMLGDCPPYVFPLVIQKEVDMCQASLYPLPTLPWPLLVSGLGTAPCRTADRMLPPGAAAVGFLRCRLWPVRSVRHNTQECAVAGRASQRPRPLEHYLLS